MLYFMLLLTLHSFFSGCRKLQPFYWRHAFSLQTATYQSSLYQFNISYCSIDARELFDLTCLCTKTHIPVLSPTMALHIFVFLGHFWLPSKEMWFFCYVVVVWNSQTILAGEVSISRHWQSDISCIFRLVLVMAVFCARWRSMVKNVHCNKKTFAALLQTT